MKQVRLSDNISPVYNSYRHELNVYNLLVGGRASFKSSTHAILIALHLLTKPNSECFVFRENSKDHKKSTFSALITAFMRLGINLVRGLHYPRGNDLWIRIPNGSAVYFFGDVSNNYENLKGIEPTPGNQVNMLWFFEITQFKTMYSLNQVVSSFVRGKKDYFHMFFEYNPPESKGHWVHEFYANQKRNDMATTQFVNYLDHPKHIQQEWIGEIALREIEALKKVDESQYRNIYLGESVALGGRVFKKFDRDIAGIEIDDNWLQHEKRKYLQIMFVGVDPGYSDNYSVSVGMIKNDFSECLVIETLVIRNKLRKIESSIDEFNKKGVELDPNECLQLTFQFLKKVQEKYKYNISVQIDSADLGLNKLFESYIATHKVFYVNAQPVKKIKFFDKSPSQLEEAIRFFNILIGSNRLKINKKSIGTMIAFEDAVRDEKGKMRDDNTTDYNDEYDSTKYAFLRYLKNIQDRVLFLEGQSLYLDSK